MIMNCIVNLSLQVVQRRCVTVQSSSLHILNVSVQYGTGPIIFLLLSRVMGDLSLKGPISTDKETVGITQILF